jgi:hypothetical protein
VRHARLRRVGAAADQLPDLTHPEDRETVQTALKQLLDGAIPAYTTEQRCSTAAGAVMWGLHRRRFEEELSRSVERARRYERARHGRPAHDPAMMVALLLYGYAIGERSSRRLERRCVEDVATRVNLRVAATTPLTCTSKAAQGLTCAMSAPHDRGRRRGPILDGQPAHLMRGCRPSHPTRTGPPVRTTVHTV